MTAPIPAHIIKQHLIDPEICIRCNTCEEACPVDAITHDSNNYVVNVDICQSCQACIMPCPTGAIDNWRQVMSDRAYTLEEQFGWNELPDAQEFSEAQAASAATLPASSLASVDGDADGDLDGVASTSAGASIPPWSAAHPYLNLYTHKNPVKATVVGNYRVTDDDTESDIRHIVLDFGDQPFPVLEGQSIAIFPPGVDGAGRPYHARQYSIASPRDGERPSYNNLSLTVKRVTTDYDGKPVLGAASNYLCDLKKNDTVQVIGPFGSTFLMPDHEDANLIMICTGTGSAPMRAMTERCRRRLKTQAFKGRLMLFFGARTERELPYFGPLMSLPKDFIDINLALSRSAATPKRYVQDLIRERAGDVMTLLESSKTCIYVCGLKGMEVGVIDALREVVSQHGKQWADVHEELRTQGRLHFETY
ncbi:MAG: benzoyl-CoA 2,3-epoxidase subunit BoxA [Candidimonas sp.]|nr:MAG: benzoyl-CoA 2,3-epoxidase subunit BoxA [Candidimonas sp.]TAM26439.1 MAG: benzoyl-CoA 2,3-epoxidase subunit BoxA [Candidimonas sp.]TAM79969.1 MAG: benzoyl-CoA 2,3-epoxidase subunit BoxA [Candidimonas sp.]